jgi:hypothetical protein
MKKPSYKNNDTPVLYNIQKLLEEEISNYALIHTEDLDDIENEQIVRSLSWSRGTSEFFIVISPTGGIRGFSNKIPRDLLVQCHNTISELLFKIIEEESTETKTY